MENPAAQRMLHFKSGLGARNRLENSDVRSP